jgi:hypothetical protein
MRFAQPAALVDYIRRGCSICGNEIVGATEGGRPYTPIAPFDSLHHMLRVLICEIIFNIKYTLKIKMQI